MWVAVHWPLMSIMVVLLWHSCSVKSIQDALPLLPAVPENWIGQKKPDFQRGYCGVTGFKVITNDQQLWTQWDSQNAPGATPAIPCETLYWRKSRHGDRGAASPRTLELL